MKRGEAPLTDTPPSLDKGFVSKGHIFEDFWNNRLFCIRSPEGRLQPQFKDALDKAADVMTEHLAQHFVDLSGRGFGSNRATELRLNHGEGTLYIRPLVIMGQEGFLIVVVEVPHSIPEAIELMMVVSHASGIDLEGYERHATLCLNGMEIPPVRVCLVRRDFIDAECLGCLIHKSGHLDSIGGFIRGSFYTRDHVSLDPAHNVSLHPCLFAAFLAIFVVEPTRVGGSGETRGINGEVSLNRSERAGALFNKGFQKRGQLGIFQIAGIAGKGWCFGHQFPCLRLSHVRHESPAGHGAVDFVSDSKNHVSQWQSWPTESIFWLGNAIAQVAEQFDKTFLFVHLSTVVGGPFLSASHFDRLCDSHATVSLCLFLDDELHCVDMFTRLLALLKIRASAKRMAVVEVHNVTSIARLGRYFPTNGRLNDFAILSYYQPSFFSRIHLSSPISAFFIYTYNSIQCPYLSIGSGSYLVKNILQKPIDKGIHCPLLCSVMNDIQAKLAELKTRRWTYAAIADELGYSPDAVKKWKAGLREARGQKAILNLLELLTKKKPPKERRYTKDSRKSKPGGERKDG